MSGCPGVNCDSLAIFGAGPPFSKRWARHGYNHRRHERRHNQNHDDAPQTTARHYLLVSHHLSPLFRLRSVYLAGPADTPCFLRLSLTSLGVCRPSLSLTPPYRAGVNNPFANRPLGIRRLCIFLGFSYKRASRAGLAECV